MGLNNSMKDFFKTNEIKIILDNRISFKYKLNLNQDDYDYLNNAKNLHEFAEALIAGAAGAGIVYGGFMAGLGVLGQIGLGIGLISNPIGWMALAAGGAGAAAYGARQLSKKADEKAYDKLPKYIKTPLDTLAENLINLFLPVCIKIALVDGKFTEDEKKTIINYLSTHWGYNRNYIENKLEENYKIINKFKYSDVNKIAKYISKETNGLEIETINNEIIKIIKELINTNSSHRSEKEKHLKQLELSR
jgi:hypothetical protein